VFIPCKLGFGFAFSAIFEIDGLGLVLMDGSIDKEGFILIEELVVIVGVDIGVCIGVESLQLQVACGVVAIGVVGAGYALQAGQAGHTGGTISVFKIYLSLKQSGIWSKVTPFGKVEVKFGGVE
jgi:hypothetical protein